jgi:hypothetical protein
VPQASDNSRYALAKVDICNGLDLRALFERYKPDAIMNLAAESHVDRSIEGRAEFIKRNIVGTFMLLEETLRYWRTLNSAKRMTFRFLHVSTDEVYGSRGSQGSFTENTPYALTSPYSASKAASDHLVRAWYETYDLDLYPIGQGMTGAMRSIRQRSNGNLDGARPRHSTRVLKKPCSGIATIRHGGGPSSICGYEAKRIGRLVIEDRK